MIKITDIKEGARNKNRVNLYTEDGFLVAVYLDTALAYHIKIGTELSEEQLLELKSEDGDKYAAGVAMEFLSYKMRTEREIRNKLKAKEIEEDSIDRVIGQLAGYGYINDEEYAQMYAQELMQKYGQRVAVSKLMQKGIDRALAERAARESEAGDEVLDGYLERLRYKYREEEPNKAKQKIIRALMGKGFEYEDIKSALARTEE
ncbi:MAG: RecX family transcriptional regulator [Christensenella sp.]|uniref:RecX family transcriptional regulator n=1 Tax=Christensenella sp. TaxID=1935934 RepID=UPI002B1F66D5|nr:RecX family transcriptional regulator [Christensenella sp.]MEA5002773.1 RecX family transcriptional regulator [Christensenella sp.]